MFPTSSLTGVMHSSWQGETSFQGASLPLTQSSLTGGMPEAEALTSPRISTAAPPF